MLQLAGAWFTRTQVCDGLVLDDHLRVFEAEMRAQCVDAAVGGRAVGAQAALSRVRVVVMPTVGDLLATRLAAPQSCALGRRHEHAVVRVLRATATATASATAVPHRALCNRTLLQRGARAKLPTLTARLRHRHLHDSE